MNLLTDCTLHFSGTRFMGALSAWQEGGPWESGRRMRPTGLDTKYKTQHRNTKHNIEIQNTKHNIEIQNTKCDMEIQDITSSCPPPHP